MQMHVDQALAHAERPAPATPTVTWPPHARRLLHVFPNFEIGGAQVRFAALAAALGPGYFHDVLSLSGGYGAAALLAPDAPVGFVGSVVSERSPLERLRACRAELRRLAPDLLLTYNWGAIEFALANFGRLPHLHMEDGFGPDEAQRQLPRRVWTRRVALARSQVVVPSETLLSLATQCWRLAPSRVRHIPNGIAPKDRPATDIGNLGLGLPPERARIAWAGALRAEKNPVRLLRAFAPLRHLASLIIIGDGPEREAVLAEAARLGLGESLQLVGRRTDSRDLIMQCDILALSSETEQMPLVVLEAMDAGLPVASVDVGDVRRMLAPENHPYVTPLDPTALGAALATLVANPAIRGTIGAANRRRARTLYTLPEMAQAYEGLILGLTGKSDRRTPRHV